MGFPRQEYWSGLPFPSPGDLPNPGIKSIGGFCAAKPPQKSYSIVHICFFFLKEIQEIWLLFNYIYIFFLGKEEMGVFHIQCGLSFSMPTIWMITQSAFNPVFQGLAVSQCLLALFFFLIHLNVTFLWSDGSKTETSLRADVEKPLGNFLEDGF